MIYGGKLPICKNGQKIRGCHWHSLQYVSCKLQSLCTQDSDRLSRLCCCLKAKMLKYPRDTMLKGTKLYSFLLLLPQHWMRPAGSLIINECLWMPSYADLAELIRRSVSHGDDSYWSACCGVVQPSLLPSCVVPRRVIVRSRLLIACSVCRPSLAAKLNAPSGRPARVQCSDIPLSWIRASLVYRSGEGKRRGEARRRRRYMYTVGIATP